MNRINPSSLHRAPGIRAAALAMVLFAVVGPQPVAARPVALTHAKAAAWMQAKAVGWAEWNESHHRNAHASAWWDSLRSAHPTRLDAEDNLLRSYTWGRDLSGGLQGAGGIGGLMAVRDHAAGRTLWPVYDDRGNVTALVDAAEHTVLAAIEYGPYGELLAVDAAPGADIDRTNLAALCPLLFSTKYLDAELLPSGGLYYYGYRYYEPTAGKWLNRDPIAEAGGLNLYGFVGNDPVNVLDPLGLEGFTARVFRAIDGAFEWLLIDMAPAAPSARASRRAAQERARQDRHLAILQRQAELMRQGRHPHEDQFLAMANSRFAPGTPALLQGMYPLWDAAQVVGETIDKPRHAMLGALGTSHDELVDALAIIQHHGDRAQATQCPTSMHIFHRRYADAYTSGAFDPAFAPNRLVTDITVSVVTNPLTYTPLAVKHLKTTGAWALKQAKLQGGARGANIAHGSALYKSGCVFDSLPPGDSQRMLAIAKRQAKRLGIDPREVYRVKHLGGSATGATQGGHIHLDPRAFRQVYDGRLGRTVSPMENLKRNLLHEHAHVLQAKKHADLYWSSSTTATDALERTAYRFEDFWYPVIQRRAGW